MNKLPPAFFTDAALTKWAAIIEFDKQVQPHEKETDFAERIIRTELSGILNWHIEGLKRLNISGKLEAPTECIAALKKIQIETDPLFGWIDEKGYVPGNTQKTLLTMPPSLGASFPVNPIDFPLYRV